MPCTAKKFEAQRPEIGVDGDPDVDHVLTTQELAQMIQSAGLIFNSLQPESFDMPFRLLHRRRSHLRQLRRRDGGGAALRR
jgi:iron only hydrogenase large subunit-like protein